MIAKFEAVIENYKSQYQQSAQQLQQLEQAYAEQKAQLVQTIHQIAGAISAVEALLNDAKAEDARPIPEPLIVDAETEDTNG